jgi:hypothetical protein
MISKTTYARKPLAGWIIPAKIVKEHNGITSSIVIRVNKHTGNITLQTVKLSYENNMMPGDKSFKAGISGDPVGYKNHGFHR